MVNFNQLTMKKLYFLLFTLLISVVSFGQTTVFQESFEAGNSGTTSVTCNDGFGDFFTRTDGSDIGTFYVVNGADGSFFFAAMDIDAAECNDASATETLEFTGIDINGFTNLTLALLAAEDDDGANQDWDETDNVIIEVQIDGGGYSPVIAFESTGASNSEPAVDTDFDGTGDGTALSSTFQEFTASVASGSMLDIRITFTLNSGDEDLSIDNIRIVDNFAPAPSILLGSAVTGLNYVAGSGPSNEGTFTVEGSNLTDDILLTAPANFEISETSGSGFGSSVTLTQSGGSVSSTTIYARLQSALSVNNYSGDVTASSSGATSRTVNLSGNVFDPPTNALVISGVYDAFNGSAPKGVELRALADIPDLSIFGIGSANNGGGSDGEEFTFPADAVSAGDYIYVSTESTIFNTFFGFMPDYTNGALSINGDDAIELFESGQVIDTFGDINTDGTGEPWDYVDGWAYRVNDTGPDGSTFVLANWTFSGTGQLDGNPSNGDSTNPFPIATYNNNILSTDDFNTNEFSLYPNPTSTGEVTISSVNSGVVSVSVYDILGKQVKNETLGSDNRLNVSSLKSGVYIMRILQDNATVTKKLVIR